MAGTTLQTNPFNMYKRIDNCAQGLIRLPGFQPCWIWKEDRIRSLVASIPPYRLDGYVASQLIDPSLLHTDAFDAFVADRQARLRALIERATGKPAYRGDQAEKGDDVEGDEDAMEAEPTIAAAPSTSDSTI